MKKIDSKWVNSIIIIIVIIFVSCAFVGCKSNKKEQAKESTETFDMKAATNVTETYMKYLMKGDIENSKKFYSKELLKSSAPEENKSLKIFGYNLSDTSEVGKSGVFKLRVSRSDVTKPFASLDEYSIKISKEDTDYKINETNNNVQKEAFIEGDQIRLRNKNNVSTNLVIDLGSIPNFAFSKDDKSNIDKIPVPRAKFSIINFAYGGDNLALATEDKDSYIALIKIDESLAVQSDKGGGGDEQGGGGNGGGAKAGQDTGGSKTKEKPIGKEITTLDLLRDSRVELISFSPEEKHVTVQYTKPGVGHCIRIYKMDGGDMIPFKFEEKYPLDKVDVVISSYDKDTINYDVIPKKAGDKTVNNIIGKWQLSLKDFKEKKM
ncbi:hypothetical protein P8V03_10875 [Clostridium sp. A1-XYC3]|uniref:Lipoprotein n=1 Tax=Clostridium tanneri TaxID=3037988 RepID=A0ABU4JU27_9CLOT|nr:hypothetical protein [Clostridium sp. A1-XYC3]MDW8801655.1 hypothetical protein [Clostridium sp. A1-XYC3]